MGFKYFVCMFSFHFMTLQHDWIRVDEPLRLEDDGSILGSFPNISAHNFKSKAGHVIQARKLFFNVKTVYSTGGRDDSTLPPALPAFDMRWTDH